MTRLISLELLLDIDGTLQTEHNRESEFKTASEKESKRLMHEEQM